MKLRGFNFFLILITSIGAGIWVCFKFLSIFYFSIRESLPHLLLLVIAIIFIIICFAFIGLIYYFVQILYKTENKTFFIVYSLLLSIILLVINITNLPSLQYKHARDDAWSLRNKFSETYFSNTITEKKKELEEAYNNRDTAKLYKLLLIDTNELLKPKQDTVIATMNTLPDSLTKEQKLDWKLIVSEYKMREAESDYYFIKEKDNNIYKYLLISFLVIIFIFSTILFFKEINRLRMMD